jgi:multiple sugar transport system substrate-binding protein
MLMKKKALVLGLSAISCLIFFSGCVKKREESGVITLRWVTDANPARKEQIAVFEKLNPGIKVKWDWSTRQGGHQKVITQIAAGTPPDLIDVSGPEILKIYAQKGVLLNLTPYCEKYDIDLSIFWRQCGTTEFGYGNRMYYDGKPYAFPMNAGPIVMFYNKKLFDEAGVPYPKGNWTWDDALEIAKKLTIVDRERKRFKQFGLCFGGLGYGGFAPLFWQFGAEFYSSDGKKCIINSEEGKKALRFLYDLRYEHHVVPTEVDSQSMAGAGTGYGGGDLDMFCAGKFAMMPYGRWGVISTRKVKDLDWGAVPLPKEKHQVTYFVSRTVGIAKGGKHPDAAFQFLKYLTGKEYNRLLSHDGDNLPPVMSIAKSDIFLYDPAYPEENDANKVFLEAVSHSRIQFVSPYISGIEEGRIWQMEMDLMWIKRQTPEETLDKVAQQINALLRKNLETDF